MKFIPNKVPIYAETLGSLENKIKEIGEKPFRARQILEWLYKKKATSWNEMSNLPKSLRTWLMENFDIAPARSLLSKQAGDTTEKLLLELRDGSKIETVIIRVPHEAGPGEKGRKTICISTQVGCAYGCKFCASGLDGWKRDLSTGEIVFQLMQVCFLEMENTQESLPDTACFDNIVVMGMGEPLANYDNLLAALQIVNAEWGLHFGARRITVSTSGLVPQIMRLAEEGLQFRLAISLHGATNEVRQKIMPINRKYPLEKLIPAARRFSQRHGRMLTLEYILIEEVNDTLDQAEKLAEIAQELHAHVNLIPYNAVEGLPWKRPSILRQNKFLELLREKGTPVTIRREKGHDINAACGQLRLQSEKKPVIA